MKKVLILGTAHTVLKVDASEVVQGNKDIDLTNENKLVGGGGYTASFLMQKLELPYTLGVTCGSGVYGDYVYECAQKENISLKQNDGLAGCAYQVNDPTANQTVFYVAGSEYELDRDVLHNLNPDEYDCVVIYSEMLASDYAEEIISLLSYYQLPIYLIFDHRTMEVDADALEELYELSPTVIIHQKEAYELYMDDDMSLDRILDDLYADALNTIYFIHDTDGIYRYDAEERQLIEIEEDSNTELFGIALAIAKVARIDDKNAFAFAAEVSQLSFEDIKDNTEAIKNRLTTMIAYK